MNEYRIKDIVNVRKHEHEPVIQPLLSSLLLLSILGEREKMGFIGRTKRTMWMGSPSLHPTYSNFFFSHISDSHWTTTSLHTNIDRKT